MALMYQEIIMSRRYSTTALPTSFPHPPFDVSTEGCFSNTMAPTENPSLFSSLSLPFAFLLPILHPLWGHLVLGRSFIRSNSNVWIKFRCEYWNSKETYERRSRCVLALRGNLTFKIFSSSSFLYFSLSLYSFTSLFSFFCLFQFLQFGLLSK